MTELVDELVHSLASNVTLSKERRELLRVLLARVIDTPESETANRDLRLAVGAIDELLTALTLFQRHQDRPKLTIFGSARVSAQDRYYDMTMELAHQMADLGWMTVTGAGPGIMEASAKGAGRSNTLGVNINLPYEQTSNAYIDVENMLVTMKYFFTRKVALTRGSRAFVVLPGGLGTMDELFEVLTLLATGKMSPAPVVLLDTAAGTYWKSWHRFIDEAAVARGYVGSDELRLVRTVSSVRDALDEIEHFFSNYSSFNVEGDRGTLHLKRTPTDEQCLDLVTTVPALAGQGYVRDGGSIVFEFDGRDFASVRVLIDAVNEWKAP